MSTWQWWSTNTWPDAAEEARIAKRRWHHCAWRKVWDCWPVSLSRCSHAAWWRHSTWLSRCTCWGSWGWCWLPAVSARAPCHESQLSAQRRQTALLFSILHSFPLNLPQGTRNIGSSRIAKCRGSIKTLARTCKGNVYVLKRNSVGMWE